MKKYKPTATKRLAILALLSMLVLTTGIILILLGISPLAPALLAIFGGSMSILFIICFIAENSRVLEISDENYILPRGVRINEKTTFQKTIIPTNSIKSIDSCFYKGDGIISRNCFFYTVKLNNGTRITFTLHEYGEKAEKSIIERMKKCIT